MQQIGPDFVEQKTTIRCKDGEIKLKSLRLPINTITIFHVVQVPQLNKVYVNKKVKLDIEFNLWLSSKPNYRISKASKTTHFKRKKNAKFYQNQFSILSIKIKIKAVFFHVKMSLSSKEWFDALESEVFAC